MRPIYGAACFKQPVFLVCSLEISTQSSLIICIIQFAIQNNNDTGSSKLEAIIIGRMFGFIL